MSDNEEEPSTPGPTYTTAPSGGHYGLEDPHFEQIVNEIDNIQDVVDMLVFGSVFLRQPQGISAGSAVPEKPSEMPSLEEVSCKVDETINHMHELEDRLKELLDNENNKIYEDQIDEYLRELEDSERTLNGLKPMLHPEMLRDGETGKTDVSWLSWRRNTLGTKLHKESNELMTLIESKEEKKDNETERERKNVVKSAEALLKTANNLQRSAQYLSWFTRKLIEYNETLSEFQRDFTVNLVAQWVQEEVNKVAEHQNNCSNFCAEITQGRE